MKKHMKKRRRSDRAAALILTFLLVFSSFGTVSGYAAQAAESADSENSEDSDAGENGESTQSTADDGSSDADESTESVAADAVSAGDTLVQTLSTEVASGTCGDNLTWVLTEDGTLTISGTGDMEDYASSSKTPWYSSLLSITSIVIESGATSIGDYAFSACFNVSDVSIADTVTSIGEKAFSNCTSLTSIVIPDSVTELGETIFFACSSLADVTLSSGISSIPATIFWTCEALESIVIPDGVTSIGTWAFRGCTSLASVTIPASVTSIGSSAFTDCSSLENVYYSGTSTEWEAISISSGNDALTEAELNILTDTSSDDEEVSEDEESDSDVSTDEEENSSGDSNSDTTDSDSDVSTDEDTDLDSSDEGGSAFYSGTSGDCSWEITSDGTLRIYPTDGVSGTLAGYSLYTSVPWYTYRTEIDTIVIEEGVSTASSAAYLFYGQTKVTSIEGLDHLDVSGATSMTDMFRNCYSLTALDLSSWDVSNVTSLRLFVGDCTSMESIDVSGWNTRAVTDMYGTFYNCPELVSITGISDWNTSNVEDMSAMFYSCSSLTALDLSGWDTFNVLTMYAMFQNCESLLSLDLSGWDVSNVTSMYQMFGYCSSLTALDISDWNTSKVTTMRAMFYGCSSLKTLDLGNWNTSNVTNMSALFYDCSSLQYLDLSGWDTTQITSWSAYYGMFYNCTGLRTVILGENFTYGSLLPLPADDNGEGYWQDENGNIYTDSSDIPSGVAATYTAMGVTTPDGNADGSESDDTEDESGDAGSDDGTGGSESDDTEDESGDAGSDDGTGGSGSDDTDDESGDAGSDDGTGGSESDDTDDGTDDSGSDDDGSADDADGVTITELSGSNRYETMAAVAAEAFESSQYAVIATGTNFPDALAAASLAGVLNAPVILISDNKTEDALQTLSDLGVTDAYIIGGTSAVSSSVQALIEQAGVSVTRIEGENRFDTAIQIAQETNAICGGSDTCIVASGANYPDALSGSPYSYYAGAPIYLAKADGSLNADTLEAIEEGGYSQIIVLGGTSAVSASAYQVLQNVADENGAVLERLGGANRYETSKLVAEWSVEQGMSYDGLTIATGTSFPDALAGSALCGVNGSVLLLSAATTEKSSVLLEVLEEHASDISQVYILGGTSAVSEEIREKIRAALE